MEPIIQLSRITKSYGTISVLNETSLQFFPGKFYVLLGKNGAGKSTLMRIIMRYEQPDKGSGLIFGKTLDSDDEQINFDLGYVSEVLDYQLPIRIQKLFSSYEGIYPKWNQKLFDETLQELRIDGQKFFVELSRGQKMQVALAAAMAIQPKAIVLDEITAVLDANARSFFMTYLGNFVRSGGTVLMATNIVSETQHYADHLILIDRGNIRLDLPVAEITKKFRKLRRLPRQHHDIFQDKACFEVGLNSDGSNSYLIENVKSLYYKLPPDLTDNRVITVEDLFIYYTKDQSEGQ